MLGVTHILEWSLQEAGNEVRIDVLQLIDMQDGLQAWSENAVKHNRSFTDWLWTRSFDPLRDDPWFLSDWPCPTHRRSSD